MSPTALRRQQLLWRKHAAPRAALSRRAGGRATGRIDSEEDDSRCPGGVVRRCGKDPLSQQCDITLTCRRNTFKTELHEITHTFRL